MLRTQTLTLLKRVTPPQHSAVAVDCMLHLEQCISESLLLFDIWEKMLGQRGRRAEL